MHICSHVEGQIDPRFDAMDALVAGFPAGTLSGAPKVRAMEIIDELETERRNLYGGAAGYFAGDGSMDTCIVLRTAIVRDGKMIVQAGVGVVADSDPASLYAHVIFGLAARGVSYLHLIEARARAGVAEELNEAAPPSVAALLRPLFSGPLIVSGGFTPETAEAAIAAGNADFVAFGRAFIANPDLPKRISLGVGNALTFVRILTGDLLSVHGRSNEFE